MPAPAAAKTKHASRPVRRPGLVACPVRGFVGFMSKGIPRRLRAWVEVVGVGRGHRECRELEAARAASGRGLVAIRKWCEPRMYLEVDIDVVLLWGIGRGKISSSS